MGKKLNYGDFTRTGWQDCGNVFDVNEHCDAWESLGRPRDVGAARRVVMKAWGDDDDAYEAWIDQQDVARSSKTTSTCAGLTGLGETPGKTAPRAP